jgi:hypothetical protein
MTDGSAAVAAGNKRQRQSTLLPMLDDTAMPRMTAEDQEAADQHLLRFFVSCMIPFAAVENPHFRALCQVLNPGYNPPDITRMRSLFLKEYDVCLEMPQIKVDADACSPSECQTGRLEL